MLLLPLVELLVPLDRLLLLEPLTLLPERPFDPVEELVEVPLGRLLLLGWLTLLLPLLLLPLGRLLFELLLTRLLLLLPVRPLAEPVEVPLGRLLLSGRLTLLLLPELLPVLPPPLLVLGLMLLLEPLFPGATLLLLALPELMLPESLPPLGLTVAEPAEAPLLGLGSLL